VCCSNKRPRDFFNCCVNFSPSLSFLLYRNTNVPYILYNNIYDGPCFTFITEQHDAKIVFGGGMLGLRRNSEKNLSLGSRDRL